MISFSFVLEHQRLELSPLLSCELISVRASRWLASRFCSLVLQHYELASTTVTGIPMKEEQNASSSANYDVEIFHPAAAHADILRLKVCARFILAFDDSLLIQIQMI